ncbi:methyltransferase domain-containing protein [Nocardioides aquiterrae]
MTTLPAAESMGFGPLRIAFDGRVLRPRPWTEAQATWAAEILETAPPGAVLELCAGAGQIGLLAVLGSSRRLVCVDVNPAACEWARHNADAAGLGARVEVREGPMEDVLRDSERFALVVADPPWVPRARVGDYPEDPVVAIDGGDDGMDLAWLCVDVARSHLTPLGTLLLQLGTVEQVDALRARLHGDDDFVVTEVRWCDRGVLVRLDLT